MSEVISKRESQSQPKSRVVVISEGAGRPRLVVREAMPSKQDRLNALVVRVAQRQATIDAVANRRSLFGLRSSV